MRDVVLPPRERKESAGHATGRLADLAKPKGQIRHPRRPHQLDAAGGSGPVAIAGERLRAALGPGRGATAGEERDLGARARKRRRELPARAARVVLQHSHAEWLAHRMSVP